MIGGIEWIFIYSGLLVLCAMCVLSWKIRERRRQRPMLLVSFSKVSKDFGGNPVFRDVDLEIIEGERIGLVGENGSGKSTLFKLIVGREGPTAGVISKKRNLTVGYVEQEVEPIMLQKTIFEVASATSPE